MINKIKMNNLNHSKLVKIFQERILNKVMLLLYLLFKIEHKKK